MFALNKQDLSNASK